MQTTSVRVSPRTRERLGAIARDEFGGVSQDAALNLLIDEHEMRQVHVAYARLRADPDAWQEYVQELGIFDATTPDGLGAAADEYPEYNT